MKKQVLIIGPGMEIGGVERSLLGLLDAIDYSRYDVDLFLFAHQGELMPFINKAVTLLPENQDLAMINKPIMQLLRDGHLKLFLIRLYCKLYGDAKAKLKHTSTSSISMCKRIVSQSVPAFSKHYDYALGFFGPHYLLTDKVEADVKLGWSHTDYTNINEKPDSAFFTPMWERLDHIVCVSKAAEESFHKAFPTTADRTLVIENIISPELVRKQAEESEATELLNDDSFKLLSVGRFSNPKNFDQIPKVCRKLIDRGYNIRWYLIGYGPDDQLIRSRIIENDVRDNVVILGKKTNPYPYMKACDLYVQPSRYEGKAVTVTEAKILHKPVLITRYATSSSQVEEGIDGWICELSPEGIFQGISYLIDHPEIREQLVQGTMMANYDQAAELTKIWAL